MTNHTAPDLPPRVHSTSIHDRCHLRREQIEAEERGRIPPDPAPEGKPRHCLHSHKACGQKRSARARLQKRRCDCGDCSKSWIFKPSNIYLLVIRHRGKLFLKPGFSQDPRKRCRKQLGISKGVRFRLVRIVQMPSGRNACRSERCMHADLRDEFPEAVMPPESFKDILKVVSEVYHPMLFDEINRRLDRIEAMFHWLIPSPDAGQDAPALPDTEDKPALRIHPPVRP